MNDTMFLEWWHWEIAGIALVLLELALPSFFIIWFGLGAMLTGFVLLAMPDLALSQQIAAWIIASMAMIQA
ncbi:MAG: NfeD family protein, partial [Thauera aminoaromatica]